MRTPTERTLPPRATSHGTERFQRCRCCRRVCEPPPSVHFLREQRHTAPSGSGALSATSGAGHFGKSVRRAMRLAHVVIVTRVALVTRTDNGLRAAAVTFDVLVHTSVRVDDNFHLVVGLVTLRALLGEETLLAEAGAVALPAHETIADDRALQARLAAHVTMHGQLTGAHRRLDGRPALEDTGLIATGVKLQQALVDALLAQIRVGVRMEPGAPDGTRPAAVALEIRSASRGRLSDAGSAEVAVGLATRFEALLPELNAVAAHVAVDLVVPIHEMLAELVAQTQPSAPQVVVAGEKLDLAGTRQHGLDDLIQLVWLAALLAHIREDDVVGDLAEKLERALDAHDAGLRRVQEMIAVTHVKLTAFFLDPGDLVDVVVSPLLQAFQTSAQLRRDHPQKAEAATGQALDGDIQNLLVRQGVIVNAPPIVGEHRAVRRAGALPASDPPRRVHQHHVKVAHARPQVL
eukprot:ctg_561.g200